MSDYKETIFLPKTTFPMKGNLAQREPQVVEKWRTQKLYQKLRDQRKGAEKFILHLGPPYANGHLHVGHAFTTTFKDIVTRSHSILGKDAPLIPGWDCHGLPIEWKIEEKYRKAGKRKEEVPVREFRDECRKFAQKWVQVQADEFDRLGILSDTKNPYITMDYASEAAITQECLSCLEKGYIYKGSRPIMWSVVEKTALAEAEVEYQDKTSNSIFVRFPIKSSKDQDLQKANCLIWTTTPWTIPGNRAIAYGQDLTYCLIEIQEVCEESHISTPAKFVVAQDLLETLCKDAEIRQHTVLKTFKGSDLSGTTCAHPFAGHGYEFDVPLIPGDHVTTEAGTGLVHTAPAHGPDDFALGKKFDIEVADTLNDDGTYTKHVPVFAGTHVYKADQPVIDLLKETQSLLHHSTLKHSYPHSWRSKAPLVYRTTPQWFIGLGHNHLRERALEEIDQVNWFPAQSKKRLQGMIQDRPDWCISRQRSWGVPIPFFISKDTGEVLIDSAVNKRIVDAIKDEGCDAWFESDPDRFLAPEYSKEDYSQIKDILDVWFDSGSTQGFVLEQRPELCAPADMYLEGSDQHRGWFQSSLLVGCATRDKAPYKSVVTHGFTVDEHGRKMSKSLGTALSPIDLAKDMGAEIIRLWVVSVDYSDDQRMGKEILKHQQDIYRRYRNTLRYLLGALKGFTADQKVPVEQMPDLEKWVLHQLHDLNESFKHAVANVDFQSFYSKLHTFCSSDLSAFYFDIRKDALYCDSTSDIKRQSALTVMQQIFELLAHWLSPVLPFTAEEAWEHYQDEDSESIHLSVLPDAPNTWHNDSLANSIKTLREHRSTITTALEEARKSGAIGSSLQATVQVYDPKKLLPTDVDFAELTIVSQLTIYTTEAPTPSEDDLTVVVNAAQDDKCERCWKILPEVGQDPTHQTLCRRCVDVVSELKQAS